MVFSTSVFLLTLIIYEVSATVPESVILRGAIGSSEDCGTSRCAFCTDYQVTPCVSKSNVTCPLQTLKANQQSPIYSKEIFYGPTVTFDFWHARWAVWLITDATANTAVLATMKQEKNEKHSDWCNGMGTAYKFCYWRNYTITPCDSASFEEHEGTELHPIVSITVVPDPLNTFGTVCPFDVFYQSSCEVRCGVAGLGCCSDNRNIYQID